MKKPFIIGGILGLLLISIIVVLYIIGSKESNEPNKQVVSLPAVETETAIALSYKTDMALDRDIVKYQTILANLFISYKEAQLLSLAAVNLDYETVTLEQLDSLDFATIEAWNDVIGYAEDLENWDKSLSLRERLIPTAHAYSADFRATQRYHEQEPERKLAHKWAKVEALQMKNPDRDLINIVSEQFGTTARESNELIYKHYQGLRENYEDKARMAEIGATTAQGLVTASKVGLFVTGAVATAGGSAVLSMPVGHAFAAAAGAQLSLGTTTGLLIEGTDVALQVNKDVSQLIFGNKEKAANIQVLQDYMSPATKFLAIKNLAGSGLTDPANYLTLTEWGVAMSQEKPEGVLVSIQDEGVVLDPAFQLDAKEDLSGLQNFLPGEYPYSNLLLKAMNQKLEDIEDAAGDYKGVWRGTMSVSLAPGIIVNPEVKLLIDEYGTAKVTIEGSEELSFGGGIGQEHSILSEFTAHVSDGTISGDGDFTYTSKVDLPAGVQLPPEYQNLASGMNLLGVVSLNGTVENDRFDGQIELSSEGGTQNADWSASRK